MDPSRRYVSVISLLTLVAAAGGIWFGRWAESAGFAVSAVSWGFAVVLLPIGIGTGLLLAREPRLAATLAGAAQASMTLAFAVFAFASRTSPAELGAAPWQILVVLAGDVVVTAAGLGVAAAGAAWGLTRVRRGCRS